VVYHDPYVPGIRLEHDEIMHTSEYSTARLDSADCVVIVTDHTRYNWQEIADHSKLIVDTRNAMGHIHGKARVVAL
jgi:UDP-N-acetyl-D-glucosamine dehydrogenase